MSSAEQCFTYKTQITERGPRASVYSRGSLGTVVRQSAQPRTFKNRRGEKTLLQEWVSNQLSRRFVCHSVNCSNFQQTFPTVSLFAAAAGTSRPLKQAVLLKNGGQEGEVEGHELDAGAVVEFVLKLHPENSKAREITLNFVFTSILQ